jgi:exopolyphosphatase/guanosine-5'-triphosphate,3'-diphosphate pyrophosphatase
MAALGAKKVVTTDYSLRDGILAEERQMSREHQGSHIALHLPALYIKAKRLGCSEPHLKQVVTCSELFFDRLQRLHRLGHDWRVYLTAAAILHDTGEAVTPIHHELHSYYIVKNANFPSMEKWENEFIAQLCRWHPGGKPDLKGLIFGEGKKPKETRDAFLKLLSMLRLADALDRGHKGNVQILKIEVRPTAVRLIVRGKYSIDLELLRVEQKKALFEQVFGRRLIIEREAIARKKHS